MYHKWITFLRENCLWKHILFQVLTGCNTNSYFHGVGKIKSFQKIIKNKNVLELTSNLGHIVSPDDDIIKNYEIFLQTVLYNATSNETYVEIRVQLSNNEKTKNTISLHSDSLSCKQAILRANYHLYYWLQCTDKIFL